MHRFLFLLAILPIAAHAESCKQPLDQQTLDRLSIVSGLDLQLKPGESHQLQLGILLSYAPTEVVNACAKWKVEPDGKGATITSEGLLQISPATAPESKFVVTADIENGRARKKLSVIVYTDQSRPLTGLWKQDQFVCRNTGELPAPMAGVIQELEFRADGWFSVTWQPFETYRDYWGSYDTDPNGGKLSLDIEGGNYKPPKFRGSGIYKLTKTGQLELHNLFLGLKHGASWPDDVKLPQDCFYTFTRSSQSQ